MPEPLTPERETEIRANRYTVRSLAAADIDIDDLLAETERLRLGMAGLYARITKLEAPQSTVVADRDAQIIAWLTKKSGEYRGLPRSRQENAADAIARMADKLSRGAVREPLPADLIEYGIRLAPDAPKAEILKYPGATRAVVEDRLARHRTGHPDAHLLQRTVRHGTWTEAATA